MKINNVLLVTYFLISISAIGQDRSDVFRKEVPVSWLGLDFTKAKLIGDRERLGSQSDIRHLMDAWDQLILKEKDKYDVAKAIGRTSVENATNVTSEHNTDVDVMEMFSNSEKDYLHVFPNDVEEIVSSYDFKGLSGLGIMFIVESFNKLNEEGSVWVTFIDMSSRQVLFTERLVGKPGGAGMRNFWGNAIHEIIEKMKKKEFEMWRKKYYRP